MKTTIGGVIAAATAGLMFKGGDGGGIGRQMGAAPLARPDAAQVEDGTAPAKPKTNRFAGGFRAISFKAVPERKPYIFETGSDKGTSQMMLAEVVLEDLFGIDGVHLMGFRIVKRTSADGKKTTVLCIPPQYKVGPMSKPYIDLKEATEGTKKEYGTFQESALDAFYVWAKERKDRGISIHDGKASAGGSGAVERIVSNDNLSEYGI